MLSTLAFELSENASQVVVILGIIAVVVIVWVGFNYASDAFKKRQVQITKREIAAYVAEGSISPEDAMQMLRSESTDLEKKITDAVAWGTVKPEKAAALIKVIRENTSTPATTPASKI